MLRDDATGMVAALTEQEGTVIVEPADGSHGSYGLRYQGRSAPQMVHGATTLSGCGSESRTMYADRIKYS